MRIKKNIEKTKTKTKQSKHRKLGQNFNLQLTYSRIAHQYHCYQSNSFRLDELEAHRQTIRL